MKFAGILLLLFVTLSCKSVQINDLSQRSTTSVVELGTLGVETKKLETTIFQTNILPNYQNPLRVSVSLLPFTEKTFEVYTEAAQKQNQEIKMAYLDSVENKPGYVGLKLLDKVSLANELNSPHNKGVNAYLQNSTNIKMVTTVAAYFNKADLNNLGLAEEVYLVNKKSQKYSLELVKNGSVFTSIDIARGLTFAYSTASLCWKKERGSIFIANIIEGNQSCAKGTHRNISRLEKRQNLFKY